MPFVLPMLVHPLEPKRHPAAAGLEMSNLQLGEFLEDSVGAEVKTGEHLFQRMAGDVAAELAVTVRAGLFEHGARAFVNTERDAQIRRDLIDGEVVRLARVRPQNLFGRQKMPTKPSFSFAYFNSSTARCGSCSGMSATPWRRFRS